jgi:hypothetical protein
MYQGTRKDATRGAGRLRRSSSSPSTHSVCGVGARFQTRHQRVQQVHARGGAGRPTLRDESGTTRRNAAASSSSRECPGSCPIPPACESELWIALIWLLGSMPRGGPASVGRGGAARRGGRRRLGRENASAAYGARKGDAPSPGGSVLRRHRFREPVPRVGCACRRRSAALLSGSALYLTLDYDTITM